MELTERIVEVSTSLFFKWGFRNVSMDQIAAELGISKRTLYENYKDKDALIKMVLTEVFDQHKACLVAIIERTKDRLVECFFEIHARNLAVRNAINPLFFKELKQYYFVAYQDHYQAKVDQMHRILIDLCKRAQDEGFLRSDIDVEVMYYFMQDVVEDRLHHMRTKRYELPVLIKNVIEPYIKGLTTPKGRGAIETYLTELKKQKK